jgi:hypothetical protein
MKRRGIFALLIAAVLVAAAALLLRPSPPSGASSPPGSAAGSMAVVRPADPSAEHAALAAAIQLADPRARSRALGQAFQALLERDFEAALLALRVLPRGADYDTAFFLLLDALHRRDPDRALALARERVTTREQAAIYNVFFDTFARENPVTAVSRLALVPAGLARENALRALTSVWLRADAPAALAWAQQLPPVDRTPALESALRELAHIDPLQVIELAQTSLSGPALERTLFLAIQKLTLADAAAAAGLVPLLPAGDMQTRAALEVARALATKNTAAALDFIAQLPPGSASTLALNNILTSWAAAAPAAAAQYVAALLPGPAQDAAAAHLATLLVREPANALAWAQSLSTAAAREAALVSIASAWAQTDPASATRWASTQPAGATATTALTGALSYWVLADAVAARDFVALLPAAAQTVAAASIAPQLAQRDPVATLAWAQTLAAPAAREAAVAAAYARWFDNAAAAARVWLDAAHLPIEFKNRLRSPAAR